MSNKWVLTVPEAYIPSDFYATKVELEKLKLEVEYLKKKIEASKTEEINKELSMPRELVEKLPREVQKTVEGIKLCYEHNHADFCFMGMRKALSTAIHIRFRREGKEDELYDPNRRPYKLPKWIELAKQNGFLSASLAKELTKEVKVFGDIGSHDYKVDFHKEEVPSIFRLLRLALDRMYYQG